jgi:hypothetical protein
MTIFEDEHGRLPPLLPRCGWESSFHGPTVGGHKMLIFTANIPIFHLRYRRYMLITNEFHEFCWSIITGTSDDGKAPYGPKINTYLNYVQNQGCARTIWHEGTMWHKARAQLTQSGAGRPHTRGRQARSWHISIFTTCQSKSVRGVSNVEKAMERLNVAVRPDKWASRAQSSARALSYSSYKYPSAPPGRKCEESEV